MSSAPKRPWDRTDPQWSSQHHRAAVAKSPLALMQQQVRTGIAELKGAGPFRLGLGAVGVAAILFGVLRILSSTDATKPLQLAKWLIAAVILHDAILAPATVVTGWLIAHVVRGRAQAYVKAGLAIAGVTAVIALPQIYRHGKSAPGTTLLQRNYGLNLAILVGLIAVVAVLAYAAATLRSARPSAQAVSSTNERPPQDH